MSDIAAAIYNKLISAAGVTALIGTRIYPSYDRQADRTYPLAVYKLEIKPVVDFDGQSGLMTATLEIAAVAESEDAALAVGNAIYAALECASGTWAGVIVQGCFLQDDGIKDDVITEPTTEEILYYVKGFRFDLTYQQ